jgi:predicted ABC-type ATPase
MRMIAGPNGSGKSTLIELLRKSVEFGVYVNADDIEANLVKKPLLHFEDYSIKTNQKAFLNFLKKKSTLGSQDYKSLISKSVNLERNMLVVPKEMIDSYLASIISDFIRHQLLKTGIDFSFETVMSHESKVDFIKLANKKNYRTYLYFVGTNDPVINLERIKNRVIKGGHSVSEEKIRERYQRSINFLWDGLKHAYRCFVFNNTTSLILLAEYKEGQLKYVGSSPAFWHPPIISI